MGRDLRYRILYQREVPSEIRDFHNGDDICEKCSISLLGISRCEACLELLMEGKKYYETDWIDYRGGLSRHNQVQAYELERDVLTVVDISEQLITWTKKVTDAIING